MSDKQEKEKKLEYLRGYRDAVSDTWEEVLDMATKGYYAKELQIVSKTKFSDSRFKIEQAIKNLESDLDSTPASEPQAPSPMPVMEEPTLQVVLDMKPSLSYAIEEPRPQRCFELFKRELDNGRAGMAIVRKAPKQIPEFQGLTIKKTIWLTKSEKSDSGHMPLGAIGLGSEDVSEDDCDYISPTQLPRLFAEISDFLSGNSGGVVLLEGIEYIVSHSGFKSVLNFTQSLSELMVTKEANLIMSLNPESLDSKQASQIKRDMY